MVLSWFFQTKHHREFALFFLSYISPRKNREKIYLGEDKELSFFEWNHFFCLLCLLEIGRRACRVRGAFPFSPTVYVRCFYFPQKKRFEDPKKNIGRKEPFEKRKAKKRLEEQKKREWETIDFQQTKQEKFPLSS